MAVADVGLRERKKAATRAAIVAAADRLFLERGYQDVLLDDVADACDVSVRTVLRYFESKEALALSHEYAFLERFRSGLARSRGDVLGYWRHHVGMLAADIAAKPGWYSKRLGVIQQGQMWLTMVNIQREYERLLAEAFAAEGSHEHWLGPPVLAAMLISANEAAFKKAVEGRRFDPDVMSEAVDFVAETYWGKARAAERSRRK